MSMDGGNMHASSVMKVGDVFEENAVQKSNWKYDLSEIRHTLEKLRYVDEWKRRIDDYVALYNKSLSVEIWWTKALPMIKTQPQILGEEYHGKTFLCWIVQCNVPQDILLDVLAYANKKVVTTVYRDNNQCILHDLAAQGHTEALECALSISSTFINLGNKYGDTPLYMLLRSNHEFSVHVNTLKVLLEFGADVNVTNKDGLKPVEVYQWNRCWKYDFRNVQQKKNLVLKILDNQDLDLDLELETIKLSNTPTALKMPTNTPTESNGPEDQKEHKQKQKKVRRPRRYFLQNSRNSFRAFFKLKVNIIRRRGRRK